MSRKPYLFRITYYTCTICFMDSKLYMYFYYLVFCVSPDNRGVAKIYTNVKENVKNNDDGEYPLMITI